MERFYCVYFDNNYLRVGSTLNKKAVKVNISSSNQLQESHVHVKLCLDSQRKIGRNGFSTVETNYVAGYCSHVLHDSLYSSETKGQ